MERVSNELKLISELLLMIVHEVRIWYDYKGNVVTHDLKNGSRAFKKVSRGIFTCTFKFNRSHKLALTRVAKDDSFCATIARICSDSDNLFLETIVVEIKAHNIYSEFILDVLAMVLNEMSEMRLSMLTVLNQEISVVMFVKLLQELHLKDLLHKSIE